MHNETLAPWRASFDRSAGGSCRGGTLRPAHCPDGLRPPSGTQAVNQRRSYRRQESKFLSLLLSLSFGLCCAAGQATGGDWPQWRYDAGRTAETPEKLQDALHLQWVWQFQPLKPAYPPDLKTKNSLREELDAVGGQELATGLYNGKLGEFDKGYEPIVLEDTMFVGSSVSDRLTAIDIATGREKWRHYVNGPVRYAPVAYEGTVIFGSDDGFVYCLKAATGELAWKFQATPTLRENLGNGRLISAWPVRGGPVLHEGRIYFGAGNWGFEGTFYYCLDAATGRVIWEDSTSGQFHRFMNEELDRAQGGPVPLGYFVIDGDCLVTPSGRDRPVRWDRHTGQLIVAPEKNAMQQMHAREGGKYGPDRFALTKGRIGEITAGGKKYKGYQGVQGKVHNLLAAQGRLFVVTDEGGIYCFGPQRLENPQTFADKGARLQSIDDKWKAFAREALSRTSGPVGYCLVLGAGTGRLAEELVLQSQYKIVVVDPDPVKVAALRRKFDAAGVYGGRISVQPGNPLKAGLPPYMARLIVSEETTTALMKDPAEFARKVVFSLRPYGGIAVLESPEEYHKTVADWVGTFDPRAVAVERSGRLSLLKRPGALPGSANVRGSGRKSDDTLVKGPLGVLWYGGELDWNVGEVFYDRHAYVRDAKQRGWDQSRPYSDDIIDGEIRIYGPLFVTYVDAYTGLILRRESKDYVPWHKGGGLPPLENPSDVSAGGIIADGDRYVLEKHSLVRLDATGKVELARYPLPELTGKANIHGIVDQSIIYGSDFKLLCSSRHDGSVLWSVVAPEGRRIGSVVTGRESVFYSQDLPLGKADANRRRGESSEAPSEICAVDVRTGKRLWKVPAEAPTALLSFDEEKGMLVQYDALCKSRRLSIADGAKLRETPLPGLHPYCSFNALGGTRKNPLTGNMEERIVSYVVGCSGAKDWGISPLITLRSSYAAYYDKTIESGTVHLGPVRSGCIPNLIPANGVLVATDHSVGCGCNYSLSTSAVFAPTPVNDMWTAWGPCINYWTDEVYTADWLKNPNMAWDKGKGFQPYKERWDARTHNKMGVLIKGSVSRIGINLGAPADRMSPDGGTLWLNYPDIGGPSPEVEVTTQPQDVKWVRRHSFRIVGGQGYRFVSATSGEGLSTVRVKLYSDVERAFTVRLYFAEHDETVRQGERRFSASVQGRRVGEVDIVAEAGAANIGLVKEYRQVRAKDDLTVALEPLTPCKTLLSGIEIAASDVELGQIPAILQLESNPWLGGD